MPKHLVTWRLATTLAAVFALVVSALPAEEKAKQEDPTKLGMSAYDGLPEAIRGRAIENWGREVTRVKEQLRDVEAKLKKANEGVTDYEGRLKVKTWFWLRSRYTKRLAELKAEQGKLQESKRDLDERLSDLTRNDPPYFAPERAKTPEEWEANVADLRKAVAELEKKVVQLRAELTRVKAQRSEAEQKKDKEKVKALELVIRKYEVTLVKVEVQLQVVHSYLAEAKQAGPPSKATRTTSSKASRAAGGASTQEEGKGSTVWVNGYPRKDGTWVKGHYRSRPKK